jgi:hypothetical protein
MKIYEGSDVTVFEISVLLMKLYVSAKISYKLMNMFLLILNFALPKGNLVPRTFNMLKKFSILTALGPKHTNSAPFAVSQVIPVQIVQILLQVNFHLLT